jgi:hypothetical protein
MDLFIPRRYLRHIFNALFTLPAQNLLIPHLCLPREYLLPNVPNSLHAHALRPRMGNLWIHP